MTIAYWHWIVFGVVLATAEMFVPSFFMLWFGVAAVLTGLVAAVITMPSTWAVVLWLILSVVICALWFKFIQPKIKTRTTAGLGGSVIVGEIGMIVKVPSDSHDNVGLIRFSVPKVGASEWACRSDERLQLGDRAIVTQIIGNELMVARK